MARSRGRSSGGLSPKKPKSPTPAPSPAPSRPQTTGGLASVVAEGMGFGAGSAVAHRAVDSVMGPRVIQLETAATNNLDACVGQYKAFEDCLNTSANDISRCQFYMNMLTECRKAGSSSGTLMA